MSQELKDKADSHLTKAVNINAPSSLSLVETSKSNTYLLTCILEELEKQTELLTQIQLKIK